MRPRHPSPIACCAARYWSRSVTKARSLTMCSVPPPASRTTAMTLSRAWRNCVAKSALTMWASLSHAIWPEMWSVRPSLTMPLAYPRGLGKKEGVTTLVMMRSPLRSSRDADRLAVDAARVVAAQHAHDVRHFVYPEESALGALLFEGGPGGL